ncbi:E3 ubiquitin-protein ligase BRE1A-like [Penaeus chinensis]|uniref:E3 ubiquitin-protein ligase BRE1A-like n=1 Tax=Penaeus chinensis TaxID=139456 RepID=UPI001FB71255|nr:E3 ubiquitin-protein ligase BRE1A-like [Penaeus chinensis]
MSEQFQSTVTSPAQYTSWWLSFSRVRIESILHVRVEGKKALYAGRIMGPCSRYRRKPLAILVMVWIFVTLRLNIYIPSVKIPDDALTTGDSRFDEYIQERSPRRDLQNSPRIKSEDLILIQKNNETKSADPLDNEEVSAPKEAQGNRESNPEVQEKKKESNISETHQDVESNPGKEQNKESNHSEIRRNQESNPETHEKNEDSNYEMPENKESSLEIQGNHEMQDNKESDLEMEEIKESNDEIQDKQASDRGMQENNKSEIQNNEESNREIQENRERQENKESNIEMQKNKDSNPEMQDDQESNRELQEYKESDPELQENKHSNREVQENTDSKAETRENKESNPGMKENKELNGESQENEESNAETQENGKSNSTEQQQKNETISAIPQNGALKPALVYEKVEALSKAEEKKEVKPIASDLHVKLQGSQINKSQKEPKKNPNLLRVKGPVLSHVIDPSEVLVRQEELSALKARLETLNMEQRILNTHLFGPVSTDTVILLVQVHRRLEYLTHLVDSMKKVQGINDTLVIFSHDFWDDHINAFVQNINEFRVMQMFFPYSIQLHPSTFPGRDPRDCEWNMPSDSDQDCLNKAWPDKYGHYREPQFTQIKHHWWWKINRVFDVLRVTKNWTGIVLSLEEDHYLLPDTLHVLNLLLHRRPSVCPTCHVMGLGNYQLKTSLPEKWNTLQSCDL